MLGQTRQSTPASSPPPAGAQAAHGCGGEGVCHAQASAGGVLPRRCGRGGGKGGAGGTCTREDGRCASGAAGSAGSLRCNRSAACPNPLAIHPQHPLLSAASPTLRWWVLGQGGWVSSVAACLACPVFPGLAPQCLMHPRPHLHPAPSCSPGSASSSSPARALGERPAAGCCHAGCSRR